EDQVGWRPAVPRCMLQRSIRHAPVAGTDDDDHAGDGKPAEKVESLDPAGFSNRLLHLPLPRFEQMPCKSSPCHCTNGGASALESGSARACRRSTPEFCRLAKTGSPKRRG